MYSGLALEPNSALGAVSLFAGVLGILFGSWFDRIERVKEQKIPLQYADKKPVARALYRVLLTRSAPLVFALGSYAVLLLPAFLQACSNPLASFQEYWHGAINFELTMFSILFLLIVYFFLSALVQFAQTISRFRKALEGRKPEQPRIFGWSELALR